MNRIADKWFAVFGGCLMYSVVFAATCQAQVGAVPATVSSEWRTVYEQFAAMKAKGGFPAAPPLDNLAAWTEYRQHLDAMFKSMGAIPLQKLLPKLTTRTINHVPVLEVQPKHYKASRQLIVYTHGGGYTLESADSSALNAALIAEATGLRVVSVDYTTAPFAKWPQITDQVIAVLRGLVAEGHPLKSMAIYGDSAGGGLATGSVLKLRDLGFGMPAAVVLWSPWTDVTESGDTNLTLKAADPILSGFDGSANARAYADPRDQKNPYVSPVYGDYSKGFPPTLIQAGSREMLLSDSIRLYRALDTAGCVVRLDLYEGMPHVFQVLAPDSPESRLAIQKSSRFFARYLR